MQRVRTILIMVLFLGAAISQAMPITYQGQLKQSGMPHTGTPDMEFRLYNSLTGGNQIGPTISLPDVPVEDGLFQVVLDFGVVYNGTRWLQVTVEGTALSPRQLITRAPMAINALEVGGLEPGASCSTGGQCASGLCSGGVCETASCSDGLLNGDETDVDCGGPTCVGCSSGNMCLINSDCTAGICQSGICQAASCSDGLLNGDETDVDCGGPTCIGCSSGNMCLINSDCQSDTCELGLCT